MAATSQLLPASEYSHNNRERHKECHENPLASLIQHEASNSDISRSSFECREIRSYPPSLNIKMAPYFKSLIFLLFVLLFLLGVTLPFVTVPLVKLKEEASFAIRNRFPRSPFFPPAVTSFRPPIRNSNRSRPVPVLSVPVRQTRTRFLHPMIEQRRPTIKSPLNKTTEGSLSPSHSKNLTASASKSSHLPPFVTSQVYIPKSSEEFIDEFTSIHLIPAQPQNDQNLQDDSDGNTSKKDDYNTASNTGRAHTVRDLTKGRRIQSNRPNFHPPNVVNSAENNQKLTTYAKVLHKMRKSDQNFKEILRRKGIDFDAFMSFIDAGATEDEVDNLLSVSYLPHNEADSGKNAQLDQDSVKGFKSRDSYPHTGPELRHKNLLTDIPFTEIVHDLSEKYDKTLDINYDNYKKKYKQKHNKNKSKRKYNKKSISNELGYNPKDSKVEFESIKHIFYHDMMMESNASTMLPPKDSPMATNFMPPKRKEKKESASIMSISIENSNLAKDSFDDRQRNLVKLQNNDNKDENQKAEIKANLKSTPKKTYKGRYFHMRNESLREDQMGYQRSRLRLVFPMKGILIFCAILGALAFVTTLILIAYAAVKCNKKPMVNNYRVNLKKGDSETTVLSASV